MKHQPAVTTTVLPGSLLSQYQLLRAVIDAPWATRLDIKVVSHVIERHFAKHGNARASLRYLEVATGAERNKIIPSLARIIDNGAIEVIRKGIGTRPTEYGLNFDFAVCKKPFAKNKKPIGPAASGAVQGTSSDFSGSCDGTSNDEPSGAREGTSTSGAPEGTSCGADEGTSTGSSGAREGTQTFLRTELTSSRTVGRNEDAPAGPTAPPVSGLEAHTAETAVDPKKAAASDLPVGFEQLWTVWPRKHHIAKARATYKALAPDPALHATLVAKATQWAAHYQQTATEKRWWKHMHTWLAEERYLEDPPEPYENPKEAAIARKRESGPRKASKQETVGKSGLSSGTPIGRHKVSITDFDMTGGSFDKEREFIVSFKIEDGDHGGKVFSHTFNFISSDEDTQTAGQMHYTNIRHATGILEPDDTSDFHGKTLVANVKAMGRIEYASL